MDSTSMETAASTSSASSVAKTEAKEEKSTIDQLPKEMHQMKIRDEKANNHDDKVIYVLIFSIFFLQQENRNWYQVNGCKFPLTGYGRNYRKW